MNMMEIVNRLQIFFPHKRIKAPSTAAGRATGDSSKSRTSWKAGYGANPNTSNSVVWRLIGRFPGSRWCQQHFVVCLQTTRSVAERMRCGAGPDGSAAAAENGKSRGCWRAAAAKLHLENNSWHLLDELVLTGLS